MAREPGEAVILAFGICKKYSMILDDTLVYFMILDDILVYLLIIDMITHMTT